jgi:hypothetical protein
VTTQPNRLFSSLCGYIKLELFKSDTKLNHFVFTSKLYLYTVHTAYAKLRELNPICLAVQGEDLSYISKIYGRRKTMKRILGLYLVVGLLISSCNLPAAGAPDPQIATAAALTVQAALDVVTPLVSPTTSAPVASTSTKAISTPTYSQPMASVEDVTNCRKGPGKDYERVTQILPAESVKIIGFFSPNYWIVSTKDGECWLSGEFTTPVGSIAAVPTVSAPPTPEGGAPKAATFPKNGWTFFCYDNGQTEITLTWNDNAVTESGYRVIRDGEMIAELPANSTYFAETIDLSSGQSVGYQIQAYNESGETNSPTAKMSCP